jgi:hypothetical protein
VNLVCRNSKSFMFQKGQEGYCAFRRARNQLNTFWEHRCIQNSGGKPEGKYHLEGLGLDRRIILKIILKGYNNMLESSLNYVLESWILWFNAWNVQKLRGCLMGSLRRVTEKGSMKLLDNKRQIMLQNSAGSKCDGEHVFITQGFISQTWQKTWAGLSRNHVQGP